MDIVARTSVIAVSIIIVRWTAPDIGYPTFGVKLLFEKNRLYLPNKRITCGPQPETANPEWKITDSCARLTNNNIIICTYLYNCVEQR